jgi:hypothetical protein
MIVLYRLTHNLGKWKKYAVLAVLFLIIIVEYVTLIKRPSFGTDGMAETYSWLKQQDNIKSVAELPLVDRPIEIAGFYVFGQLIHNKPLVNSALARSDIGLLNPLGNEKNPEVINFLKARGVDAVILHTRSCDTQSWGTLLHKDWNKITPEYVDKKATAMCVYSLNKDKPSDNFFAYARTGFSKTDYLDADANYWVALAQGDATIDVVDQEGKALPHSEKAKLTMKIGTLGEFKRKDVSWGIYQNGTRIASGTAPQDENIEAAIDTGKSIEIRLKHTDGSPVATGEYGLNLIEITKP